MGGQQGPVGQIVSQSPSPTGGDGDIFLLDTLRGDIIYVNEPGFIYPGYGGSRDFIKFYDVAEFFRTKKKQYRSLSQIPYPSHLTMQFETVPESSERITAEQVLSQKEREWGTDLDVQFIRQLYRDHGWPDTFRKAECFQYLDELMKRIEEEGRRLPWKWDVHDLFFDVPPTRNED
ncbi:hypothetical protein B0T16DRAFT_460429 [Cercophora newfieldiana]|uniref:Uncharacterized protein n=1 Tax=Cercophora newfieldiana TaxID=92897 RepID=A0AA39Y3D8_9PEZI|nr:hypothetical protein B0T16DRAFT_460429 [Cercophora newfieldiana]